MDDAMVERVFVTIKGRTLVCDTLAELARLISGGAHLEYISSENPAIAAMAGEPAGWLYERGDKWVMHKERSPEMVPGWTETPLYAIPGAKP